MKPVRYPKDPIERSNLKRKYVEVLGKLKKADGDNKLKYMQKVWKKIRKRLPSGTCFSFAYSGGYPFSISGDIRSVPS